MIPFLSAVGSNVNYSQSALGSMSYSNMKEFLSAFISDDSSAEEGKLPSPQIIPEAKLRTVLALVLTGAQVNSLLRTETAMEWYINTFCESSFFNILAKDVRQVSIIYWTVDVIVCSLFVCVRDS